MVGPVDLAPTEGAPPVISRSDLAGLSPTELERVLATLEAIEQHRAAGRVPWLCSVPDCDGQPHKGRRGRHARAAQRPPNWEWDAWLLLAGRGFGKTRTGAEWSISKAREQERGALIGPTAADTRDILIEGESGIMACAPPSFRPVYEPSKRRLTYPNGAVQIAYSADEPDRLRGPQHHYGWFDELAAWRRLQHAWDMAQLGMRLGDHPQICITTTPRPLPLVRELLKDEMCAVVRGSTYDNLHNLAPTFRRAVVSKYEGTTLGRQELDAEVLDDLPGAMWQRAWIRYVKQDGTLPEFRTVTVAVDPAGTGRGDETGIVVVARGLDGHDYVLDDRSEKMTPDQTARRAYQARDEYQARDVVVEDNGGKDWIEGVLKSVWKHELRREGPPPIRRVNASQGKKLRAQPVAMRYEQGRVFHTDTLPELEDQMCTWIPDEETVPKSPDRVDALVHGVAHHMRLYDRGETALASPHGIASRATRGVHPLDAARQRRAQRAQNGG